jgi:hypothetical protein
MRNTARLATLTASAGAALLLAASVALAQESVVDTYSGVIPIQLDRDETAPVEPTAVKSTGVESQSVSSPTTLPFTGGEVVLLTGLGAGALAAGAALVVAGRRRSVA